MKSYRINIFNKLSTKFNNIDKRLDSIENLLTNQIMMSNGKSDKLMTALKNSGTVHIGENEIVTKIFSGLKLYLDTRDLSVAVHIALDGIWEENITVAWANCIGKNFTVLDIGANFGYFGLLAGQFTNKKKSKIVMFEANPAIIPFVNKSLSINWLNEQCVIENFAVSDKEGIAVLSVLDNYIGSSSVESVEHLEKYLGSKMQIKGKREVEVPSISIDSYCDTANIRTVDLIKMDIEGHEEKAYKGMRGTIKRSPNVTMFIEFTKESYDNPERFYQQMLKYFGYLYLIDKNGGLYVPKSCTYQDVIINGGDDWVMPVFSKNKNLIKDSFKRL